jgi:hypothetical protein
MTEPRYLPIPFLPAYGVDRDGVVCRLDPYRKVRPIPFHEALRKAARDPFHRSVRAVSGTARYRGVGVSITRQVSVC